MKYQASIRVTIRVTIRVIFFNFFRKSFPEFEYFGNYYTVGFFISNA